MVVLTFLLGTADELDAVEHVDLQPRGVPSLTHTTAFVTPVVEHWVEGAMRCKPGGTHVSPWGSRRTRRR